MFLKCSNLWKDRKAVSKDLLSVILIFVLVGGAIAGIFLLRARLNPHIGPEPKPPSSSLTLTLAPSTITEGLNTTLSGTFTGTKENKTSGLGGKIINFCYLFDGISKGLIGQTVTDSSGNFNYSWLEASSLAVESYLVTAEWDGDSEYPEASATTTLLVIPKGEEEGEDSYPPPYLVVDPSSYATLNFPNGTNIGVNFELGSSKGWYESLPEEGWLPGLYYGSYGFEADCCGLLPVWDVETTVPGFLQEQVHDPAKNYAHLGSYSMRMWLKYGPGNDKDQWWYHGVSYPGVAGIKGPVEYIIDLGGGNVIFDWWAFREPEKFIDNSHVKAYLMEVVVDVKDTSTGTIYKLHYMHTIINQLGAGPKDTSTEAYLYEEGIMSRYNWRHYSHDITLDFQRSFNKVPSAQYKVTDVHLWTRWYGVSCGASGAEYPTAGIDFDDLMFTKVYGAASSPIHFAYAMSGCSKMQAISANLSAQVTIDGKIISEEVAVRSFPAPQSDLWSDTWDVNISTPSDANLDYGQEYGSVTITVTVNIVATYDDGSTASTSARMTVSISDVGWYGCIVPKTTTVVSVTAT